MQLDGDFKFPSKEEIHFIDCLIDVANFVAEFSGLLHMNHIRALDCQ